MPASYGSRPHGILPFGWGVVEHPSNKQTNKKVQLQQVPQNRNKWP